MGPAGEPSAGDRAVPDRAVPDRAAADRAAADQPDPADATTAAEFVDGLRRLKLWTGMGYRELEKRASAAGHSLPRSTLTAALARDALPREDLVVALVRACGGDEELAGRWARARRQIAAAPTAPPTAPEIPPTAPDPSAAATPAPMPAPAAARSAPRTAVRQALVAVAAVLLAGGVATTLGAVYLLSDPAETDRAGPTGTGPTGTGPSGNGPTGTGPTSAGPGPAGWVEVRAGRGVTLADGQSLDLETGEIVAADLATDRYDLKLSRRADRMTATPPGVVAVLDTPGEQSPVRCVTARSDRWDGTVDGLYSLGTGRNICVTTSERRYAMITIERAPDTASAAMTFRYTVWERATT